MSKTLEVIYDKTPSGGCGCNCGCGGGNKVEEINDLITELKTYEFNSVMTVDSYEVSDAEQDKVITKINELLENTNAQFRVDTSNFEDVMSDILPLVVLDGSILTAYGTPTLYDVVQQIEKRAQ